MKCTHFLVTISLFILPYYVETAIAQVHGLHVQQIDNGGQGDLAGTVTNDIFIDFVGELRGQQILLELEQGKIYEHPLGTHLPPDPVLFATYLTLVYDTFLTMGGTDSLSSKPVLEVGKAVNLGLGQDGPTFGPDFIMAAWAPGTGVAIFDMTDFLTARVTLSDDAHGTWRYYGSVDEPEMGQQFLGGYISNGIMIVPEPKNALLSSAALVGLIFYRHRRSSEIRDYADQ